MSKERKAFSWSTSIVIHSILAILLLKAGYHYAMPEGDVVSIEVGSGNQGVQTAIPTESQDVEVKAPAKTQPIAKPIVAAQPKQTSEFKRVVEKPDAQPLEQEDSPVVVPIAEPSPEPEAQAEESQKPEEAPPVVAPVETQAENTDNQDETSEQPEVPQEAAAPGPVVANPDATGENSAAPPKFGTPGTTIDEARLVPKAGNKEVRYPWMARMKRQEGTTVVAAYVRKDGTISHAMIVKSSGVEALDKEVMEIYPKWRFQPGTSGWVVKPYHFRLKK
ncbi:MAG: TonB family protein [Oligoflexia bacterium]|nr:TonB family protein [Oligoflexia bacterium]